MREHEKKPRHYAVELTEAWAAARPVEPVISAIPETHRPLARSMARVFCLQVKRLHAIDAVIDPERKPLLHRLLSIYSSGRGKTT